MSIILFNMMTLDGYFAGPNGEIDWHHVDEEFNDFAIAQLNSAAGLIFGRVTYQLMASYWPTDSALRDDPQVAAKMNALPKIVFSKTLDRADWNNTLLVKATVASEIAKLKQAAGKDWFVFGSANLASALTGQGLIDEYRIMVNPVVLGSGEPLFPDLIKKLELRLTDSKSFRNGNVLLYYRPVRAGANLVATASIVINAPSDQVWNALVDPKAIQQYMFGTKVTSDWRAGSPIVWKGEWQGKAYEDKGVILQFQPERVLQYSHFSPLSGMPDRPENYHTVTVELSAKGNQTAVTLEQDRNSTEEERTHSEENWRMMLTALKKFVER